MAGFRTRAGLAPFRHPGFTRYWATLITAGFAVQIQTVAVEWHVYDLTRNPFDLGLVGLSQFLPALLLVLVTGAVADRFPRRRIMGACLVGMAACSALLFWMTRNGIGHVGLIFAVVALFGTARAFYAPARQALLPNLVPAEALPSAIAINTSANQAATICGPVAGGLLYGISPVAAYGTSLALFACSAALILSVPAPLQRVARKAADWNTLVAGFRYIWTSRIVLGAISLDLFAVILGGAVALLPVFARDILEIGPIGLGLLRAAPAIGAISMGFLLMAAPIRDHAGRIMFVAVAVFGLANLIFGFSDMVWLSIACLVVAGAADMVSVYVRGTLIQLWTPDELRGRVNAVNQVFIGASNEVGAFRAGSMAALMGPVAAVAVGGIGTIAVAGVWWRQFPGLAAIRRLDGPAA